MAVGSSVLLGHRQYMSGSFGMTRQNPALFVRGNIYARGCPQKRTVSVLTRVLELDRLTAHQLGNIVNQSGRLWKEKRAGRICALQTRGNHNALDNILRIERKRDATI